MIYPAAGDARYDVLTQEVPERSEAGQAQSKRELSVIKSATGLRRVVDKAGVPFITRSFRWVAFGRDEINALRSFVSARKGRVVPCWVPTFQSDLQIAVPGAPNESQIRVHKVNYAALMFTSGNARRHLAVLPPDGTMHLHRVLSASDNGDGTETLMLDPPLTAPVDTTTLVSFLTLCRLANDTVEYTWHTPGIVEAVLQFAELPKETP